MTTDQPAPRLEPGTRVHLVGVGGAGMSPLASILAERGHRVSGSDLRGGRTVAALEALGAVVHRGHDAAHVEGADLVVVSAAVPADSPEVVGARERGIPVLRRAELLALLAQGRRGVFVAGTHGKTTTTAMVTVVLQAAGLDPSFAIGGVLDSTGASAHDGTGDLLVAEADESDGSFLAYHPDCAVVTNLELDHHDRWSGLAELTEAFAQFLAQRQPDGLAVLCADDPGSRALADGCEAPVQTYGLAADADVRIADLDLHADGSRFLLEADGASLGVFGIRPPGRHNVLNAAAAIAVAHWAGADLEAVRQGLAQFSGTQRRFQRLGEIGGITVVDDYAHHPTEVAAVLDAARQSAPSGRVVAAFQPHRYSRTKALGSELGQALAAADVVVVTDVYGAGERPVPGVTGAMVADAAKQAGATTHYLAGGGSLAETLLELVRHGDLVLTLGAGDITEVGPVILHQLERRHG